jgi:iron complex transport system substrate-binding protein
MAPNLTEILFALGLDDEIVGVTAWSDYPPQALNKPKVGTFWQPNIEAVIAAKPDLVVTLGFEQQTNLAGRLDRIGCNCLTVNIERVGDLFEAIKKTGAATSKQHEADKLVREIKDKLDRLAALVGTSSKPRVLWVVQREPLRVAGRDTFVNEMIELAGGENAIGPTIHKYPPIGGEQVIAGRADVIIEPAMGRTNPAQKRESTLQFWSKFENVPAVMNDRICVLCGDTVSRLGPRLYEGTEAIARCLHPEHFAD